MFNKPRTKRRRTADGMGRDAGSATTPKLPAILRIALIMLLQSEVLKHLNAAVIGVNHKNPVARVNE